MLVVLSLFAVKTVTRNEVWHSDLAFFADGVKQNPDNANLRSDLGFAYWGARDPQRAIEQWNISLMKDPNNFWALNNLGMAAVSEKRYADAVLMLQRAIKMRPQFTDAHLNLAEAFKGLHRAGESEREFQAAIESSPLNYDAHNRLAAFYIEQGRTEDARQQYLEGFCSSAQRSRTRWLGRHRH